jgi:hypothetical protein
MGQMKRPKDIEQFSEEEAKQRFETALRVGVSMPAKPHAEMKLGKLTP